MLSKDEASVSCCCSPLLPTEVQEKFDAKKMHVKGSREQQKYVDDGSGKVMAALVRCLIKL